MVDVRRDDHRNVITTELFVGRGSDFGVWSGLTPAHANMIYHQIVMVASGAIATGTYKIRMSIFSGDSQLEYSVDTGKRLSFTGGRSAMAQFAGPIQGIHLEVDTPLSSGKLISCALSSSMMPFDQFDSADITDGPAAGTVVPLTGWRDLRMAIIAAASGGGTPTEIAFGPSGNTKQLRFGVNDSVYLAGHIDHDIKEGSLMYPHVHWSTDGTNTGLVAWEVNYMIAAGHNQANFGSEVTASFEEAAAGTAWRHMITEDTVGIAAPEVDSLFICELKRIAPSSGSNSDDVFGLFMDLHYEVQQYATADKSPPFY